MLLRGEKQEKVVAEIVTRQPFPDTTVKANHILLTHQRLQGGRAWIVLSREMFAYLAMELLSCCRRPESTRVRLVFRARLPRPARGNQRPLMRLIKSARRYPSTSGNTRNGGRVHAH
jgi:hypothetical protein